MALPYLSQHHPHTKTETKKINYQERLDEISPTVESAARLKEDSLRLQQAIRRLAETDRAIISAHLDGYNNGEIAEIMGIGLNHVSVKLHRIKQQLTTILK
jgi:RNA polymerase sigma-70 factor (ECF subfamily)